MKPEVRRLGEHLLHTNERSERMIEGLLVLARSDRGLTSRTPLRLDEVVGSVLRSSAELAEEHNVTLESELLARTVAGDPVLEWLATNLVQNAIIHNEPGGAVHMRVGPNPALIVQNTGPFVRTDTIPALFAPFRWLERPDQWLERCPAGAVDRPLGRAGARRDRVRASRGNRRTRRRRMATDRALTPKFAFSWCASSGASHRSDRCGASRSKTEG
jgi:light-regulated signal transduction histidine kinase (bacteriophytochrome)